MGDISKAKTPSTRMRTAKRGGKVDKMHKVMSEFKDGTLHAGSKTGPKVTNRKQAIAIGFSEARRQKQGKYK